MLQVRINIDANLSESINLPSSRSRSGHEPVDGWGLPLGVTLIVPFWDVSRYPIFVSLEWLHTMGKRSKFYPPDSRLISCTDSRLTCSKAMSDRVAKSQLYLTWVTQNSSFGIWWVLHGFESRFPFWNRVTLEGKEGGLPYRVTLFTWVIWRGATQTAARSKGMRLPNCLR